MQYLYLLIVLLSLTSAALIPDDGANPHRFELQRRVPPGHPDYNYEDDPRWRGNRGGTIPSAVLIAAHIEALARAPPNPDVYGNVEGDAGAPPRDPPGRPRGYRRGTRRREQEQTVSKTTRKLSFSTKTENLAGIKGLDMAGEAGISYPFPKKGLHPMAQIGATAGITPNTFTPAGRVTLKTQALASFTRGFGPLYYTQTIAYTTTHRSDLVPVPDENVKTETIYQTADGREVYFDRNWRLRDHNDEERVRGVDEVYRSYRKRSLNLMESIDKTANAPSNSTTNLQAQWQVYYSIYTELQTNATALLAPVINGLCNKSDAYLYYEMAWSIQSQLIGSTATYEGAYTYGLTTFDDFMDQWLLAKGFFLDVNGTIYQPTNRTISNETLNQSAYMITLNTYLQDLYYTTWDAAVKAVNVSNPQSNNTVLDDLGYFARVVSATNRTDIVDKSFHTVDEAAGRADAAWFLQGLNATG